MTAPDPDQAHAVDEAVGAVYRAFPDLAKCVPRDLLSAELERFAEHLVDRCKPFAPEEGGT